MLINRPSEPQSLSLFHALIPVVCLIGLLGLGFYIYGDESALGPNQVALTFASMIAVLVAWLNGHSMSELGEAAVESVTTGLPAIFILLAVGALIGTWAMSGTLMAMVYHGLKLLNPDYFYVTAALICAVVALSIGSSWTVAGTIGIGLIGISGRMGLDPAITAGAIISGSYFGDKSSPLSDTTNLACAASGANLYEHIRETLKTSIPALALAMAVFWMLGEPTDFDATAATKQFGQFYQPSLWHFLPLLAVLALAIMRLPPFTTIFIGALLGAVVAVAVHPENVIQFADARPELPTSLALLKGAWSALANGYVSDSGAEGVDTLLTRGGMESMLGTIWLIIAAMGFGGIVEKAGVLDRLILPIIQAAKSVGALVSTLVGAAVTTNILAADQYIAIVLPGRMFRGAFEERGLPPTALSRAVGDSATVTSALIPWNSCGAYMAATLAVPTLAFAPYALFNIFNPIITILFAFLFLKPKAPGGQMTDNTGPATSGEA